ncbi:MAG: HAMP domain-containing histidine kinase [Gemmatimonadetes bacterium]|nr:HAMP domain-containing histidine kinase [Gemmatimonadota bacterium]
MNAPRDTRDLPIANGGELVDALAALDHGARLLEGAYRELWSARESERVASALREAEAVRDLCHELGNPLSGVRGLAELLRRELQDRPDSERASRLLDKMCRGLDSVSAIVSGRSEAPELAADGAQIVEEAVGLALAANRAEGCDVRFSVNAPTGIELTTATSPFREIAANLIRNAAEACGRDGHVAVRLQSDLDAVTLEVEDDGPGLPDVAEDALFRRGFSTKGARRGRGLGIVRDRVEEANGTIRFERRERGTRVCVVLPRGGAR